MKCGQEDCRNWDGWGCPCAVLDLEPDLITAVGETTEERRQRDEDARVGIDGRENE